MSKIVRNIPDGLEASYDDFPDVVRYVDTIADLANVDAAFRDAGGVVIVTDEQGDNRSFKYNSAKSTENDGGTVFNGWEAAYRGYIKLEHYGYSDYNSDVVNEQAYKNAIGSNKKISLEDKTYKIVLTNEALAHSVYIEGKGDKSTLDFSGSSSRWALISEGGNFVEIGTLANDAYIYNRDITITDDASSLKKGDIVFIWDSDDYSFSSYRNYYNNGEICIVNYIDDSNPNHIFFESYLKENYTAGINIKIAKLDNPGQAILKNFKIICTQDNDFSSGIRIERSLNTTIENIHIVDAKYNCLTLSGCFNTYINYCNFANEGTNATPGYGYGVIIGNSQRVFINGGIYKASRHALTTGGGDQYFNVPCRDIKVIGGTYVTTGYESALDSHGNIDGFTAINNTIEGGFSAAGKNSHYSDNKVKVNLTNLTPCAIGLTELVNLNHTIIDNDITIYGNNTSAATSGVTYYYIDGNVQDGGDFTLRNNIKIHNNQTANEYSHRLEFTDNCTITNGRLYLEDTVIADYPINGAYVNVVGNAPTQELLVYSAKNNKNCGALAISITNLSGDYSFNKAVITGGIITNAGITSLGITAVEKVFINDVVIENSTREGFYVVGKDSTSKIKLVKVDNVTILNHNTNNQTSSSTQGGAYFFRTEKVILNNLITEAGVDGLYSYTLVDVDNVWDINSIDLTDKSLRDYNNATILKSPALS